jgi:hypothetical protein
MYVIVINRPSRQQRGAWRAALLGTVVTPCWHGCLVNVTLSLGTWIVPN